MSGFQITITDAGRAALINAQNTGTVAFVLSQIGVSTQAIAGDLAGLTALPNERKRLTTMAGDVVADDTLHVTIRDESADAYALRSFGLYASTGVLFAVYSQADPILEKSAAAMLLLAVDARLVALGTANVEFGPVGFTLPPASETVAGVVEIATDAEVDAGVDPWRVITARTLKRALQALSGFALKDHKHDAADTTSGVFNVGRIPALAMEKITGLAVALANKADKDHKHDAADTTTGTFNVARIPALAMEKITGLIDALARYGELARSQTWTGSNTFTGAIPIRAQQAASTGAGFVDLAGVSANRTGSVVFRNAAGDRLGFVGNADSAGALYINADVPNIALNRRPTFNGRLAWDAGNFDPTTKADLAGAYFTGNSGVKHTGFAHFSIDSAAGQNRDLRFNTDGVTRWSVRATSAAEAGANAGSNFEILRYADNGSVIAAALSIDRQTGAADFRAPLRLINTDGGSGNFVGGALLRLSNFAPGVIFEDRSTGTTNALITVDSHVLTVRGDPKGDESFDTIVAQLQLNQPTAPPGHNTLRLATCAFVQQEIAAIPAPGNSTYTARGLIELATDAEAIAGTDQERAINPYILKRRVDARAASNAETLAGSLTDKFVTPSSLWSFAKSIGLNGYAQIPGTPLVIQWGRQAGAMSEGQRTVMLPIAFGGGCVAMLANPWNSSPTADYYMQIVGRYLDRLVFMLNSASGSSGSAQGFDWLAIGFATGTPNPAYSSGGGGGGGGGGLPPGGGGEEPIIRPEV
ncbi:gp53-like domain-containing protein [Brevundimonas diminuta]|uniref:gp53-like domain-containing protein n=1 Tax=Brevundimonas diminuta TaxID=293 RepID=UPI003209C09C